MAMGGNVPWQGQAAVGALLDVNGIVKVTRRLAVNGDNRQMAEVFSSSKRLFADGLRSAVRFFLDFPGEHVREMVLADDDFDVHAEFARAAEDFHHASGGSHAAAGKANQLDIDDG